MKERIGIFGGSFDPVHNGHKSVVESCLNSNLIDKMLVLLTPNPPHKQDTDQISYKHRLQMLKIAFWEDKNVEVSDLEKKLESPSYTLQTICYLQENHPENVYFYCMGEDSIVNFHNWYRYEEILERVPLLVAERPGWDRKDIASNILERTIFIEHNPVNISSTDIRLKKSGKELGQSVPIQVIDYIREHKLYELS